MLHIIIELNKKDPDEFYNNARQEKTSTHKWASKSIGIDLMKKNKDDYRWYQRVFNEMKQMRERADYHPDVITSDEGNLTLNNANSMLRVLKKNFK